MLLISQQKSSITFILLYAIIITIFMNVHVFIVIEIITIIITAEIIFLTLMYHRVHISLLHLFAFSLC